MPFESNLCRRNRGSTSPWFVYVWLLLGGWLWSGSLSLVSAADQVDYLKSIKPILTANCVSCHGEAQPKRGLRLDTAAAALIGGEHGPAWIAGDPAGSLIVQALEGSRSDLPQMPFKKPALSAGELELIKLWIKQGALAPKNELSGARGHWAFRPIQKPSLPSLKGPSWPRQALDAFVLSRLESDGLSPSPEAAAEMLIRRLFLDLTGIPPSPAQRESFLADSRPGRLERLVDGLLESPHFGERWARHWLDRARYADSNGYSIDAPRKMWRYRDWVINAINEDLPYDQFITEQLAGDLLENATLNQRIATGFHRNTQINEEGGIDVEQFRIESIFDRVSTTATVFLGLTLACAQCHDHKFDPFTQTDYYRMFALFNDADEPAIEVPSHREHDSRKAHDEEVKAAEADLAVLLRRLDGSLLEWERNLSAEQKARLKPEVREVLALSLESRDEKQQRLVRDAHRQEDSEYRRQAAALDKLKRSNPGVTTALVLANRKEPRITHRYIKGDFTRPAEVVEPGVPAIFPQPPTLGRRMTRLDFSRWLASPSNPLTARVAVNQVWQQLFGRGLVETENDFGIQGTPPANPELLDWLAADFRENGWSLKRLIRSIVLSSTYLQSSVQRNDSIDQDPSNRLLSRQSRIRLEAEIIRDVALAASGKLSTLIGGPSVFPPQPDGVMDVGQVRREWKPSAGAQRFRRGLYTHYWRATPHPSLSIFDAPDAFSACTRRLRSNTPLQAMTLLNDPQFHELARELGARLAEAGKNGDREGIRLGYLTCLTREPGRFELSRMTELLEKSRRAVAPFAVSDHPEWIAVARVFLNLDETMTRE